MTRAIAFSLLLVAISYPSAKADDPNDSRLDSAKADYRTQIKRFNAAVLTQLERAETIARRRGSLDNVDTAKNAIDAFKSTGQAPDNLPASVKRILVSAKSKLKATYENEIKQLVQSGADDEARLYTEELEELLKEPKVLKPTPPCLLYTSPSPRDQRGSRMPSSA